ncbi:MAG: response regulator transcription factor [Gammaproteobacteria bacterium]|nr:response regulator transcription factor [Gammaproteobacteria bacterium]
MTAGTVFIIDDDASVRDALLLLVDSLGMHGQGFADADAFLAAPSVPRPACVITDVCMPGTDGITLQRLLRERSVTIPVIVMSAHGDIPMAVSAVRAGAIDFVEKPFRNQQMIDRLREAIELDRTNIVRTEACGQLTQRMQTLTTREKQVFDLLANGYSNKRVAATLHLSPRTVETHRARILRKMHMSSITALVHTIASMPALND